ncbi:hypothetical protein [Flammeovirga pacifica]|nr:hypothetical protein [Flammeovirga pacifica]
MDHPDVRGVKTPRWRRLLRLLMVKIFGILATKTSLGYLVIPKVKTFTTMGFIPSLTSYRAHVQGGQGDNFWHTTPDIHVSRNYTHVEVHSA